MDCWVYYKKREICLENLTVNIWMTEYLNCVVNSEVILPESYIFSIYEGKIILTNGFVKKTQKTPKEEIQIAKDRRKDFIERMMKDENI